MAEHDDGMAEHDDGTEAVPTTAVESWLVSAARAPVFDAREVWASALPPGTRLHSERFTILRKLGSGGAGVVYAATDHRRGSTVAIKTLARQDPASIYRLKLEFRTLVGLRHPNLVRLHDLFTEDGSYFFSMDWVDGEPFDRWVRRDGHLDVVRLRAALPQLASAVAAIHAAGKTHRDLKPSNVVVNRDGRVVVLDFGLSADSHLGGVGQTLSETAVMGTPAYMAPEQAAGRGSTAASDLYALGAMLYEALSGRLPFEGRAGEMLAAKQTCEAPPVTAVAPDSPRDLARWCSTLLRRDPRERPALAELQAQLGADQRYETGGPMPLVPAERAERDRQHAPVLVGRDRELAALHEAYRASIDGDTAVVVLVSGESGIGKSRLCEAFLNDLVSRGPPLVLRGRCYEREAVPFKAFDAVFDELTRTLRRLPDAVAATLVPANAWALRRLFPVLDRVPAFAASPERPCFDVHDVRNRAFVAVGELLRRLSDRQPVVVWVDDLHWSDHDSMALITHVLRQVEPPRFLFVGCHRAVDDAEAGAVRPLLDVLSTDGHVDDRSLELGPIPDRELRTLIADTEKGRSAVSDARGNPFLALELCRQAEPRNASSLHEVIRARVRGLPSPEQDLLRVISLVARPIAADIATRAANLDADAFHVLDRLVVAKLVTPVSASRRLVCYHDVIREAVQSSMDPAARVEVHRALVAALEKEQSTDDEQLAFHLEAAGEGRRAVAALARAAERASETLAFDRAAQMYARARALGWVEDGVAQAARVREADALSRAGRRAEAAEAYLASRRGLPADRGLDLQRKAALELLMCGQIERGTALLDAALRPHGLRLPRTIAGTLSTIALQRARLHWYGLEARQQAADARAATRFEVLQTNAIALGHTDALAAVALMTDALLLALRVGDPRLLARAFAGELWSASMLGASQARLRDIAGRAEALLARTDDAGARGMLHYWRGWTSFWSLTPDLHAALHDYDRFLELHADHPTQESSYLQPFGAFLRTNVQINLGRLGDGARAIPAQLDEAWARGNLCAVPMLVGWNMALARIAAGHATQLERDLERARDRWPTRPGRYGWQDLMLFTAELFLGHHVGRPVPWPRVEREFRRFMRSTMRGAVIATLAMHVFRGQAALAALDTCTGAREKRDLLHAAELSARESERLAHAHAPAGFDPAMLLSAALAFRQGAREDAIRKLAPARGPIPTNMPFYAHAARRRLGVLLGGREGADLVEDADRALRAAGAVDPVSFAATLLPGYPAGRG